MRVLACREWGGPERLAIEEWPSPVPGPGEVLVRVAAVGVNFTDVLAVAGRSQLRRHLPFVPGVEAAGTVVAVGPGVTRLGMGMRVLGTVVDGAFAEEALFPQDALAVIPDSMDWDTAAVFFIAAMTAHYALVDRARLKAGESLLVLGAGGGAGLAAVEIGKAQGVRVIAGASSEEKLALAVARGADAAILYPAGSLDLEAQKALTAAFLARADPLPSGGMVELERISSLRSGAGFSVVFDGVGGSYAEPALRALAWQGRYLSVGFAAGMPKVALGPALFKNADIMGVQLSDDAVRLPGRNADAMARLFRWFEEGRLRPQVTESFDFDSAAEALQRLARREARGRLVVRTGQG
ncbi:NADPH:quinone oxidoreductase family protein [Sphingosinicella terrae]|uniref:NADPH:quinone oxidoreductase family protein n=1 Tax=Sphingosinicella terrae TaxID=2172047 RepID=UPI000E0D129B|nr:NADPH:quinone oxidoreductase family protein [Sphingosinicella terrae]